MKNNVDNLQDRFPFFYRKEVTVNGKTYTRRCSISVGPGWYKIIEDLCKQIEEAFSLLPEGEEYVFEIIQVKEKFGNLRFYYSIKTNNKSLKKHISNCVVAAENKSSKVCEVCGLPGQIRQDLNWWKCLCVFHYNKERVLRRVFGQYYNRDLQTCYRRMIRSLKKVLK